MTFISNVSDLPCNNLNNTSDIQRKLFPTIRFDGEYEVALVDCILRNTCDVLREDLTYDIKATPLDLPLVIEKQMELVKLGEYHFIRLLYKEFGSMNDLPSGINRRIFARKNGAFQLNYSMEQVKIYISNPINSGNIILNDDLRDVLGFKQNKRNITSLLLHLLKHQELLIPTFPTYAFLNEKPVMIILFITI